VTSIGSAMTATASTVFLRRNAHRHTVKRVALMAVGAVAAALCVDRDRVAMPISCVNR
jgi:hypothetical protein